MATTRTRKRARNDDGEFKPDDPATPAVNEAYEPAVPALPLNVASLAAFMEVEHPDHERLGKALELAAAAAAATIGRPLLEAEPHAIRHGVHMLAAELLLKDALAAVPDAAEIPAVVRAFWKQAG
jgi:hypothetical protein